MSRIDAALLGASAQLGLRDVATASEVAHPEPAVLGSIRDVMDDLVGASLGLAGSSDQVDAQAGRRLLSSAHSLHDGSRALAGLDPLPAWWSAAAVSPATAVERAPALVQLMTSAHGLTPHLAGAQARAAFAQQARGLADDLDDVERMLAPAGDSPVISAQLEQAILGGELPHAAPAAERTRVERVLSRGQVRAETALLTDGVPGVSGTPSSYAVRLGSDLVRGVDKRVDQQVAGHLFASALAPRMGAAHIVPVSTIGRNGELLSQAGVGRQLAGGGSPDAVDTFDKLVEEVAAGRRSRASTCSWAR